MPKIEYKNAVNYLLRVITTWSEFCKHHPYFELAVIELLAENKRLAFENERLKEKLKNEK